MADPSPAEQAATVRKRIKHSGFNDDFCPGCEAEAALDALVARCEQAERQVRILRDEGKEASRFAIRAVAAEADAAQLRQRIEQHIADAEAGLRRESHSTEADRRYSSIISDLRRIQAEDAALADAAQLRQALERIIRLRDPVHGSDVPLAAALVIARAALTATTATPD